MEVFTSKPFPNSYFDLNVGDCFSLLSPAFEIRSRDVEVVSSGIDTPHLTTPPLTSYYIVTQIERVDWFERMDSESRCRFLRLKR